MTMNKGRLFVISGPSGAGKGSICDKLQYDAGVYISVSMTTREPRPGEIDGISYFFVGRDTFTNMINEDSMLEYAEVFDEMYGTPKTPVIDTIESGKDVILEIDVQGALQIKKSYPEAVFVFVLPPNLSALRSRITGRGSETDAQIEMRLTEALREMSYIGSYDYLVINDKLEVAADDVRAIMKSEHLKIGNEFEEVLAVYSGDGLRR
jgi:guanylate kinase